MEKKGQIILFVIVGIIAVVLIIGFFYFKTFNNKSELINPEIKPLYSFFTNCIEESEKNIIEDFGFTGGVYKEKTLTLYFYEGESYVPKLEEIESNMSLSLEKNLESCFIEILDNFPDFDIKKRKSNVKVIIKNDKIIFNIDYPLEITKEERVITLKKFNNEIKIRLGVIYNTALKIIQDQLEHPESLCMTCIGRFAIENDVYVEIEYYDNSTLIFTIKDENSKINNKIYKFMFINKY